MNKFKTYILIALAGLTATSCDGFLSYTPSDAVDSETAIESANDVTNAINGLHYTIGDDFFLGRNATAIGDFASDNAIILGGSHFSEIYQYTITEALADTKEIWDQGYAAVDRASEIIEHGNILLNAGGLSAADEATIKGGIAQAHAIKALSYLYLVNLFALPYDVNNLGTPGIIVVGDEGLEVTDVAERSTLGEVYDQIEYDIDQAMSMAEYAGTSQVLFSTAAIYALDARINLYMQNWADAQASAQAAIDAFGGTLYADSAAYYSAWSSITPSTEEIFTLAKSASDNLSANSINTLYSTYDGNISKDVYNLYEAGDIRLGLYAPDVSNSGDTLEIDGLKYMGTAEQAAVSNIPVFRLPEMYLILAEAKVEQGDVTNAVADLTVLTDARKDNSVIPSTADDLLDFIAVERRKELVQEGQRWFDARRTGELMTRIDGTALFTDYDVAKFVYPIPQSEIGGVNSNLEQTEGWSDYLPVIN